MFETTLYGGNILSFYIVHFQKMSTTLFCESSVIQIFLPGDTVLIFKFTDCLHESGRCQPHFRAKLIFKGNVAILNRVFYKVSNLS